ncbi:unnamed protein product [Gadus morhua 'NCC']
MVIRVDGKTLWPAHRAEQNRTSVPLHAMDLQRDRLANTTAPPARPTLLWLIHQSLSHTQKPKELKGDDSKGGGGDKKQEPEEKKKEPEDKKKEPDDKKKEPEDYIDPAVRTRKEGCKIFYWKSWTAC